MSRVGDITPAIARKLSDWLGEEGLAFFSELKKEHGTVSPVLMMSPEGGPLFSMQKIPHPVHLREGMQVRNFMRDLPECFGWEESDGHVFDNVWQDAVEAALKIEDAPRRCFICGEVPPLYRDDWGIIIKCEDEGCVMHNQDFHPRSNINAWDYLSLSKELMVLVEKYTEDHMNGAAIDDDEMFVELRKKVLAMRREFNQIKR